MKVKILTGIVIAAISITAIVSTASRSENSPSSKEETFPEQIERIASKNFAQKPNKKTDNLAESEWNHQPINPNISMKELAGKVNKEYGIREDILRYIEKEIPADNEKAKKAAFKYAQRMQFIYYQATQTEALKAFKEGSLALECLSYSLPDRGWIDVSRGIEKLMRNTPERDKHMWSIAENYFSWKVLGGAELTTLQKKELCESGRY